jgi:hypothetical protein
VTRATDTIMDVRLEGRHVVIATEGGDIRCTINEANNLVDKMVDVLEEAKLEVKKK